jgi:flagellar basal body-associated protein FliL
MNSQAGNKNSKLWLIIVVVLVVVCCCCLVLVLAGVMYLQSENMTLEEVFSNPEQLLEPPLEVTQVVPQELEEQNPPQAEEQVPPQEQNMPENTVPPTEMEDYLIAIATSGVWKVNEETQEVIQLSNDVLDAPQPYRQGLSPDKKYFAYITGEYTPTLVVLDMQTNNIILETPLSGPNSQIKPDMNAGDPGQSVLLAMQFYGNLSWSPDSSRLAFVAAMDNFNTDLYLFNPTDLSITRLTDENSNAAHINWSPDGYFIQYVTVNNFGTGAGMDMDAVWVYDTGQGVPKMLEQSISSGEEFLAWIDNKSFYMTSWSAACSNYNLRAIDAVTGAQEVILESCFSGAAYDPVNKFGIVAVSDMFIGACQCGEVEEYGTYSFGASLGMSDVGVNIKKFEQINAYGVELLDPGNVFAVYTDGGLSHLFDQTGFPIPIPDEVLGLKPSPSPNGQYWAWYPYYGDQTGLWVTDNQMNVFDLSSFFSNNSIWSDVGNRLYYFEFTRIFYADAPDFSSTLFAEIPEGEIYAIGK